MTTTELYAEVGKIYIQMEHHQKALQQLDQMRQQRLDELRHAVEAETKAAEEAKEEQ
jgi:hypothetical protein